MAKISRQTVLVDRDRLYKAIESRGLGKREVSRGIGYSPDYISNSCSETTWRNTDGKPKISMTAAIALKGLYGIEQSEYEYVEPIEPIAEPEPVTDSVVCNKEDWCGASEPCKYCFGNSDAIGRGEDWWNAPYKAGSEQTMTREQAITILNCVEAHGSLVIKAKEMAIDALRQEPCDDCISRQQAMRESYRVNIDGDVFEVVQIESLMEMPSVKPQTKIGHWIEEPNGWVRCSCCSDHYPQTSYGTIGTKFCPHCGARMEGGNEEE